MDIFIKKLHPAGYHARKQTVFLPQSTDSEPPNIYLHISFPILVRLIGHSRGVGMCPNTCRISVQDRQNKGKAEMETLETQPQIPPRQAVEGAGKTLLKPSLWACPGNARCSRGCWRIAPGSMGQCCLTPGDPAESSETSSLQQNPFNPREMLADRQS